MSPFRLSFPPPLGVFSQLPTTHCSLSTLFQRSPSCPERSRWVSTAFLPRAKSSGAPNRPVSPLVVAFAPNRSLTPLSTAFTQTHRGGGYAIYRLNAQPLLRPGGKPFVFRLLRALCALFLAPSLCFQWFADSFAKTPGVWVLNTESKPQLASHNVRPSGLQSRAAAPSWRRLCDSPWSFDA